MNREDKIKIAIDKGITCNPETGEVFGVSGKLITGKSSNGYITISVKDDNKKTYSMLAHQFIYYLTHNKCVDYIDHIDRDKLNNRINNLRSVTNQQNAFNRIDRGCYWNKKHEKWYSQIRIDGKKTYLGYFETEQEALQVYQDAKKLYQVIC